MNKHSRLKQFTLCTLLLFCSCLSVYAQEQLVTVKLKKASLKELFSEIEKQTTYRFSYRNVDVDNKKSLSISKEKVLVTFILDEVLIGRNLDYSIISDKSIVIFERRSDDSKGRKIKISGTVKDTKGESIIGANVSVKGTTTGVITDLDGRFSLEAPENGILSVSFIGYTGEDISINGKQNFTIILSEDVKTLDEVVVVGYGVQKKSVVTAAISSAKAEDLVKTAPTRIENVLQGLVSGVSISRSSGQPGDGARVRIRGIGTINNSDPLYIVDGMPIDGGIDYLNPSDIESVEVLKDAASAAIYGSRGANGVILVTTKKGSSGQATVNYNFSYGWQNPWKKRAVLDATEYAILMNEQNMNSGLPPIYENPQIYGKGTDWQDKVFNKNAPQVSHQLSVSGGTDKGNYYFSFGYFNQEGTIGGNFDRSNYERYSLRANSNYTLFDHADSRRLLSVMKMGANISYSRINSTGITTNSEFGSPLGNSLLISPMITVYAQDQAGTLENYPNAVRDSQGRVYSIAGDQYNEVTNPIAQLQLPGAKYNADKIVANFWAELEIYKNIKFKSSYGADLAFWGNNSYEYPFYLGKSNFTNESKVSSDMHRGFSWQIENTITYSNTFAEKHDLTLLLGQSAKSDRSRYVSGVSYDLNDITDPERAQIDLTKQPAKSREAYGSLSPNHRLASYFARINYNYDEKYMVELTMRRDGSSNFGMNNKWGTFPSASIGWNVTNEKFMANRPIFFNYLKIRASWGKNGNESIGNFLYTAMVVGNNNYTLGKDGAIIVAPGAKPNGYFNKDIKWEESEQTNIGFDARFFNNSLSFTFDWFNKKTNGMLMQMSLPSYIGDSAPYGNVGDMKNTGVEMELSYRFKVSDLSLKLTGNASYLKNELIRLGNIDGWSNYDTFQSIGTITRAQNGMPFPYFYGVRTDGIFQTWDEINDYRNEKGELIQPKAQPGDVRFMDLDGNGVIDEDDRTMIGKGMPDWTFGFNIGAEWKGFDFSAFFYATIGNDVMDVTKRTDVPYANLPAYMLDRWTGPGSSNTIPRLSLSQNNNNWQSSDLYVKNGAYLRLKTIQLGYTLPKNITKKAFIDNLRFYVASENLFTLTGYDGFDPEISSGGTSLGVDRGVYPQSRTVTIGASITF